jgi:hypothetical protein
MEWQPPPQQAPARQRITLHDHIAQDLRTMYDAGVPWFTKEAIRVVKRSIVHTQRRGWAGFIDVKGLDGKFDLRPYNPNFFLEARLPNGDFFGIDPDDPGDNVDAYYV